MRILWHSNGMQIGTGYGNQTGIFARKIKQAGIHDIVVSAFYGREGHMAQVDGILELPRGGHLYGNDIIASHMEFVEADVAISLIDPFVLEPGVWSRFPWCAWVPVDCMPVLPGNIRSLKAARWLWSMSQFGHQELERAGFKNVTYMPHGVRTDEYKPMDRREARQMMGDHFDINLDDKFLVVTVAANKGTPSRKNFTGMIETFAQFVRKHPEVDATYYIHTEPTGQWAGENIRAIAEAFGVADRVILPSPYSILTNLLGPAMINAFYNAADVMMLLSRGEGFGLPQVEAQAAGCPVIVTDFSAQAELCFAGWRVAGIPIMFPVPTVQKLALVPLAVEALEKAYEARGNEELRQQARAGALDYDADVVYQKYMAPALERMEKDLVKKPEAVMVRGKKINPTPSPSPSTERGEMTESGARNGR